MPRPTETVPLLLKYDGPDVDDGSMSIDDIVPVLQGFASAYGKIAAERGLGVQHRIRITGVKQGSADILLEVWDALGAAANQLTALQILGTSALAIVSTIVGVIKIKKHIQNQPFSERISSDNTISIVNSQNVTVVVPVTIYDAYKRKVIDADIAKIVKPLRAGHINAAEIHAGKDIQEHIDVADKPYLEITEVSVTETRETWIPAKLNALTKSTNSGWLYLSNGKRVFYRFVGDNPLKLHNIFGTYDGPVNVFGQAHMDDKLEVVELTLLDIEKLQGELFPQNFTVSEPE
jgi:hypothetical protein